jgi:VWFA-related protein
MFRAGIEMVRLTLTVRDRNERLITDLTRDDFVVLVDGRPVDIAVFSRDRYPVTAALLFGTANGQILDQLRAVGRGLVAALEPDDRAAIGSFSNEAAMSPVLAADARVLHRVLNEELWTGFGNAVVRAMYMALATLGPQPGKRAIVVVGSDRADSCLWSLPEACADEGRVRRQAFEAGVLIYGVWLATPVPDPPPSRTAPEPVRRAARETGGGYRRLADDEDRDRAMAEVLEEIRHEYLLGFMPPSSDGRTSRVTVRLQRPGLTARVLHLRGALSP